MSAIKRIAMVILRDRIRRAIQDMGGDFVHDDIENVLYLRTREGYYTIDVQIQAINGRRMPDWVKKKFAGMMR